MTTSTLLIVGKNEALASVAKEAMEAAFPGSAVRRINSLDEASKGGTPRGAVELLALIEATDEQIREAASIQDEIKLPRWGVVACRDERFAGALCIAADSWTPTVLRNVFPLAWEKHALFRDNTQFRGDLLSIGTRVTHDLRSPLGGILSGAEILSDYLSEHAPAENSRVKTIIDSEEDILKLIRQLTVITTELSQPFVPVEFDMGAAVASAVESFEGKITIAGATVKRSPQWPKVHADQKKVERIWKVLLENSLRHSGNAPQIELGWDSSEGSTRYWITNSGPGVKPDRQDMLFRPFHLLHEPNSGKGLSLSLAARLIQFHGGTSGYSEGQGGHPQFYFTLV